MSDLSIGHRRLMDLSKAIRDALMRAAQKPEVPLDPKDVDRVAHAQALELISDPVVNFTYNLEPWYKSRVTLGALITLVSVVLGGVFGVAVTDQEKDQFVYLVEAVGVAWGLGLTLYGRWRAREGDAK